MSTQHTMLDESGDQCYAVFSTTELFEMGLIDESVMDELFSEPREELAGMA